jgi:hypothetical protein
MMTGSVKDFNAFEDALAKYGKVNPMGQELYEHQIDYIDKKKSGYDFKKDKKTRKIRK